MASYRTVFETLFLSIHPFFSPFMSSICVPVCPAARLSALQQTTLLCCHLCRIFLLLSSLISPHLTLLLTFPRSLSGECHACEIELKNTGSVPLTSLLVKLSHPAFVFLGHLTPIVGTDKDREREKDGDKDRSSQQKSGVSASPVLSAATTPGSTVTVCEQNVVQCNAHGVVDLKVSLAPGQSARVPAWIRGARPGKYNLGLLFRYSVCMRLACLYVICSVKKAAFMLLFFAIMRASL